MARSVSSWSVVRWSVIPWSVIPRTVIPWSLIPWIAYLLLVVQAAGEEPVFPYKACITADDVYVRSGPGQTYYPTDKLREGQEVEVYRHDPGGWYAIRPPEGSFTWVSGKYLTQGSNNLAVVSEDRVAARVGSRFSDIRDVIQVRLNKGEVVELTDVKEVGTGPNRQTWYKIAPPSGEFRWVFGKYVDPDYRPTGIRKARAASGVAATEERAAEAHPAPAAGSREVPARSASYAAEESKRAAGRAAELPPLEASARGTGRSGRAAADSEPEAPGPEPADVYEPYYDSAAPRDLTPEEYRNEVQKLDLELSRMVVEEPTVWAFDDLRLAAEGLESRVQTAVERGLVRVLLRRIARFERIKTHHARLSSLREQVELVRRRPDATGPALASGQPAPAGGFDGAGRLTPVVSQKLDAPRYALMGEDGQVRCYVTPAAGVRLGHYVGQQVGVSGTRGYIPEQRAYHVMAQHVTVLGGGGRMR